MSTGKKGFFSQNFAAILLHSARGKYGYNKGILIVWKEKLILFNVILFLAGAALMLVMGVRATEGPSGAGAQRDPGAGRGSRHHPDAGRRVPALAFTTPAGDTRRLPYPLPRKAKGFDQGSEVTLYYDPDHPEKVYVEGDRAVLGAEVIYYALACCCWRWGWCCWPCCEGRGATNDPGTSLSGGAGGLEDRVPGQRGRTGPRPGGRAGAQAGPGRDEEDLLAGAVNRAILAPDGFSTV